MAYMNIFSTSFFHFAKDWSTIKSILVNGFNVYYCLEEVYSTRPEILKIGIPMVSFCDIPLNYVSKNHYGKYAIGMSRSWGIAHNLVPVCYYPNNKDCFSTKSIIRASEAFMAHRSKSFNYGILGFSKPMYKIAPSFGYKSGNNYLEREWRKVYASKSSTIWKTETEYNKYRGSKNSPKKKVGSPLKFGVNDIDFVIIREEDRQKTIEYLLRGKFKHFGGKEKVSVTKEDRELLLTKIVSYDSLVKNI